MNGSASNYPPKQVWPVSTISGSQTADIIVAEPEPTSNVEWMSTIDIGPLPRLNRHQRRAEAAMKRAKK